MQETTRRRFEAKFKVLGTNGCPPSFDPWQRFKQGMLGIIKDRLNIPGKERADARAIQNVHRKPMYPVPCIRRWTRIISQRDLARISQVPDGQARPTLNVILATLRYYIACKRVRSSLPSSKLHRSSFPLRHLRSCSFPWTCKIISSSLNVESFLPLFPILLYRHPNSQRRS